MPTDLVSIDEDARRKLRATEDALFKQNEILLGLAKSAAIDSGDLTAAFREIMEASSNALGIEQVGVWFYADEKKDAMSSPDLYTRTNNKHVTTPLLYRASFPTYFEWLARERVIPADDAHTHPATCELSGPYLTALGIGAMLDAPIRWQGNMVGIVCHEHVGGPRTWTQDEVNFAGSMADLVGRALEANARHKAQDELRAANLTLETRIQARTAELVSTNDELKRLHGLKDEMFQNVSHELRTPLTLILSPVERMLERESTTPDDRRRMTSVRNNALRLLGLVNDVLDLAKLETTRAIESSPRALDVGVTIRRLVGDVEDAAAARGLTTKIDVPTGLFYRLDEGHLERIVLNLLSNAMKFTPKGGRIELKVSDDKALGLRIDVRDTGIGIPKESLSAVFDRFRQLDHGQARKYEGTGIGLALVSELTKLLGGAIMVESQVGEGSVFTVTLPASARAEAPEESPTAPEGRELFREAAQAAFRRDAAGPRTLGEHGPLVVIAEDDPGIRTELTEILSARCRVLACRDGEEALEIAIERLPHVVISDVMMPNMDGHELVRALRQRPELRDTAVILISAKADVEDRVRGRQLGVDSYLTKPFHPKEVLATVEGLLRSRMRLIGRYLVHERLGAGSQSQVFRAENVETGEVVALKVISQAGVDDSDPKARLSRERRTLMELRHPNIVRVIDEGTHEGGHFMAIEYLQGSTLTHHVRQHGPFSSDEVIDIGSALASALDAVHAIGLIHRDVKGSNVFLVHGSEQQLRERVRLIDFGTVYNTRTVTDGDSLVGTLPYLAPEILEGGTASVASDVYALGMTLYHLCTGRLPFARDSRSDIVEAVLRSELPPVGIGGPGLEAVLRRALERDPAKRYARAADLGAAIEKLERGAVKSGLRQRPTEDATVVPVGAAKADETMKIPGGSKAESV